MTGVPPEAPGERDRDALIAGLDPFLLPGVFCYVRLPPHTLTDHLPAIMRFEEEEGVTLVLPAAEAEKAALPFVFPCRQITLRISSSLEAVGLMAKVSSVLADADIPCNVVAGFTHDHLFVPENRAAAALTILKSLSGGGRAP